MVIVRPAVSPKGVVMDRVQFTFTFTNAQPGYAVTFSAAVWADASETVPTGPRTV